MHGADIPILFICKLQNWEHQLLAESLISCLRNSPNEVQFIEEAMLLCRDTSSLRRLCWMKDSKKISICTLKKLDFAIMLCWVT